jgi:hypothetical protein
MFAQKQKQFISYLFLTIVLTSVFVFAFYHKVLFNPGQYLFSDKGDGIKNYYTTLYHIKHDSTYMNFGGMNYPYGDLFSYSDGQPALAWPIKYINKNANPEFVVATTNLLMILSIIICAVFIYLILIHFQLPAFYASIAAFGIALLQPQIFRMGGHYALSYAFFFPISWFLLINFFKSGKSIYTILLFLSGIIWSFLHPYLGMISGIFIFSYWIIYTIEKIREKDFKASYFLHAFAQSILPLLIYKFIMGIYDFHLGRTSTPWGMFFCNARAETVFIPNHEPFKPLVEVIWTVKGQNWEGWSYIGVSAVIICGLMIFRAVRYLKNKRKEKLWLPAIPHQLRYAFFASILILFFSMAYPFQLGMRFLLDWMPFIKQFRCLGRFAWAFYYVINIFSVYLIYRVYRFLKIKSLTAFANTLVFLTFLFYIVESIPYHKEVSAQISEAENIFISNKLPDTYKEILSKIEKDKFQAILPLPFYHIGSENFGSEGSEKSKKASQVISYYSGIPLISASLARTSIPESKNIFQLFSPEHYEKAIEKDFPNNKNLLILYTKEELEEEQKWVLNKANILFENEEFVLAELMLEHLFNYNFAARLNHFQEVKDKNINKFGFYVENKNDLVLFLDFENLESDVSYQGKGAASDKLKNYFMLVELSSDTLEPETEYTASFWFYNAGESRTQCLAIMEFKNEDGSNVEWKYMVSPMNSPIIDGDWSLITLHFKTPSEKKILTLLINGDKHSKLDAYVDNLMIQKKNTSVYKILKEEDGKIKSLFYNNHVIQFP